MDKAHNQLRCLFFDEKDTKLAIENVRSWVKKTENGIQLLLSFIENYEIQHSIELTTIFCILNSRFNKKLCYQNDAILRLIMTLICSPYLYAIREKDAEIISKIIRKWTEFEIFTIGDINNMKVVVGHKVRLF